MSRPHPPLRDADALVRAGVLLFAVGAVAVAVTLVPLLTGGSPLPLAFYLLCLLAPAGLGVALWGVVRTARRRGRRVRTAGAAQR